MRYITMPLGALAIVAFPVDAKAYLDPGTGSYIVQILIAAVVGGLFAVKMFWHRIKNFFSKANRSSDQA